MFFHNGQGKWLPYSTFYDRWMAAVAKAHAEGTLLDFKVPAFHDLRHSHASALISAGHSLTYVQRRFGRESIQTASDRYGHLLPEADDAAMDTIDESLRRDDDTEETTAPVPGARGTVYIVHLGERLVGFWKRAHALETSAAWSENPGGATRVETWSAQWWSRTVGNGVRDIRSEVPDRLWVWQLGPAVYGSDGTELASDPNVHELRGRWAWEWDDLYTSEPARSRAEWLDGADGLTVAAAWGLYEASVRAAYAEARTDALRICGLHPGRGVADGRGAVT
ncbi:site-specific integrase [Streptomyces sp. PA03-5A]|nr:site-specific integrase [Streptomyces sp. PA03-5A]